MHPIHFAVLLCVGTVAGGLWLSYELKDMLPFALSVAFAFFAGPQLVGRFSGDDDRSGDYQGTAAGFTPDP